MTNDQWKPYLYNFLSDTNWIDCEAIDTALTSLGIEEPDREHWRSKIMMELAHLSIALHGEEKPSPAQIKRELTSYRARLLTVIGEFYRLSPAAQVELALAADERPLYALNQARWPAQMDVRQAQHMIETLHQWCERALQSLPEPRVGRGKFDALFRFAVALGRIYEEATGKRATRVIRRDFSVNSGGPVEAGEYRRFANKILASTGQQVTDEMAKRSIAALRNGENVAVR